MAANTQPIFSKLADIQGGLTITAAAGDYTGQSINNSIVFQADTTNGGFLQKLRFKAAGSNSAATVARIYINEGTLNLAASISAVSGTPTGTPSTTGGTLQAGGYFAKIQAVDQWGGGTAMSTETAQVNTTGTTGSIVWNWTAVTGAAKYRVFVGPVTGGQVIWFESTTNSYTMTTASVSAAATFPAQGNPADYTTQNMFYGEIALPVTTGTTTGTVAGPDIDYPMNIALPPGWHVLVGLSAAASAGWVITAIGGKY